MFSTRPSAETSGSVTVRRIDLEHGRDRRVAVHDARAAVGGEQGVDAVRVAEAHPVGEDPEEVVDRARVAGDEHRRRRPATSSPEPPSAR